MSLKELLLKKKDRPPVKVPTPGWEPEIPCVWVRVMSGEQRDALEQWKEENPSRRGFRAHVAAMVLCEEDGTPMAFDPSEEQALGEKDFDTLEEIAAVGLKISGIPEGETDTDGEIEKN